MLRNALTAMPGLRAVTLLCPRQANHGLSWDVLQAILAVPQLHQFTCHRYLFSPKATPIDHLVLAGSTSLTSFRYMLNTYRCSPRTHEPEKTALKALLRTHHQVLEVLWMPTESTPWRTICALEWPSLRELRLRGEFDWSGGLLLGALGNMPNLRLLKLDFTLPHNTHPQTIWPQGYNAPYSWPMLEDVQVSFPCPDDHLYARLPLTLCRLSLRFFPHQIVHEWCTQYHQDDEEDDLIRELVYAFPNLRSLKLLRYRQSHAENLDVKRLGRLLRPLKRLVEFWLYADLDITPRPHPAMKYGGSTIARDLIERLHDANDEIANTLVGSLPPSVKLLKFLEPWALNIHKWHVWRIVRTEDEGTPPHAVYDLMTSELIVATHKADTMVHDFLAFSSWLLMRIRYSFMGLNAWPCPSAAPERSDPIPVVRGRSSWSVQLESIAFLFPDPKGPVGSSGAPKQFIYHASKKWTPDDGPVRAILDTGTNLGYTLRPALRSDSASPSVLPSQVDPPYPAISDSPHVSRHHR
ncbi:hypothetical protein ONZ51_g2673 [Trametes cubensis]|uniref:Uncharacterized protein n=1 Tax=Trametes cubensis TaxID=1111947 RepID=A0AAD7TZ95_9APHY|nr:hypothetical protein ONZ51_g2673 [Trametes cubensis]